MAGGEKHEHPSLQPFFADGWSARRRNEVIKEIAGYLNISVKKSCIAFHERRSAFSL